MDRRPQRVGDLILNTGKKTPARKKERVGQLRLHWKKIVGERNARHSCPTRIARGELSISADGSAWAAEISTGKAGIIKEVNRVLGEGAVKTVRIRAVQKKNGKDGRRKEPVETAPEQLEKRTISPHEEATLEKIEDGEIREALRRLLISRKQEQDRDN